MRKGIFAALMAATLLGGCSAGNNGPGYTRSRYNYTQFDYDRPELPYDVYYAERYYRNDARYQERRMGRNDRIYRGGNGQYFCRRSDGTTGLIISGIAGGAQSNILAKGESKTLGAILDGAAAAAVIDSNNVRCH